MPLPKEPLVIHGGCSCSAIRYKITIPPFSDRPVHYADSRPATDPDAVRMPSLLIDHCSDCRTGGGGVLPLWMQVPQAMYTISCLPRTEPKYDGPLLFPEADVHFPKKALAERSRDDACRPPYVPALELLGGKMPDHNTWLNFYSSTYDPDGDVKRVMRSFCGRCGTNLAYVLLPMVFGWMDVVDVILGTVDPEDLKKEFMRPDHQLWWQLGIPWVQDMVRGEAAAKHPIYRMDEVVKE